MKTYEDIAEKFLKNKFKNVQYEPIKNQPPDFLCDNNLAVEVTYLEQTIHMNDIQKGWRNTLLPLEKTLKSIVLQYRQEIGPTWFLHYSFPEGGALPSKKEVSTFVNDSLYEFLNNQKQTKFQYKGQFKIEFTPRSTFGTQTFVIGGGPAIAFWVEDEIRNNVAKCVIEKSRKIQKNKDRFSKWWLVLIDGVDDARSVPDMTGVSIEYQQGQNSFEKIILIDRNNMRSIEVN